MMILFIMLLLFCLACCGYWLADTFTEKDEQAMRDQWGEYDPFNNQY